MIEDGLIFIIPFFVIIAVITTIIDMRKPLNNAKDDDDIDDFTDQFTI